MKEKFDFPEIVIKNWWNKSSHHFLTIAKANPIPFHYNSFIQTHSLPSHSVGLLTPIGGGVGWEEHLLDGAQHCQTKHVPVHLKNGK